MPTTKADLQKFWNEKYETETKLAKSQTEIRAKAESVLRAARAAVASLSKNEPVPEAPKPEVKLISIDANKMTKAEMAAAKYANFWAQKRGEDAAFIYDNGNLAKDEPTFVIKPPAPDLVKSEMAKRELMKAPQQKAIEKVLTKAEAAKKKVTDFWAKKQAQGPGFTGE
jgi:hypothetical protein